MREFSHRELNYREVATVPNTGALVFAGGAGGIELTMLSYPAAIPAKLPGTFLLAGCDAAGARVTSSAAFLQSMREM